MENIMNKKTLRVLELDKILNMLVDKTTSNMGKEISRKLKPSMDIKEVEAMLSETNEASALLMQMGNIPMGPIYDMGRYVKVAEIGSFLSPRQLLDVSDTLRTARNLKLFFKKSNTPDVKFPILDGLGAGLFSFKDFEDRINSIVIGDHELADHASKELSNIRRSITKKNDGIRSKLNSIISSSAMQKHLQDAIITIRQDRFVVPVKADHKSSIKGLVHDRSSSGQTLYIEPMEVVQMNNELKELKLKEEAEIERILLEITGIIGDHAVEIRNNQEMLIQIDFIIAKGKLAVDMKAMQPVLTDKRYIKIRNGRHPLLDQKTVVPSNVWFGDQFSTLLITGPNTGGKTVTLKTIGLLILMAQSGLHIPADHGTTLHVFNKVFADIGDEQSIEQSLSTFSSHMTNIVEILKDVDENSLVLFDELGAGTDPTEGAALAMAILSKLFDRGIRTVATTHYAELKHFALTKPGIENACVEFDVATLSPTYRLLVGVPGKSNAFEISRKLGLTDDIIDSAKHLVDHDDLAFEDIVSAIEENRKVAEEERDEAIKLRVDVEKLKTRLETKNEKLDTQRDRIVNDAKAEARKILKEAKDETEKIVKELRQIKYTNSKEENKRIEEMRGKIKDGLDSVQESFIKDKVYNENIPKNLKIGDSVKVLNLDQNGTVASLPNDKGDLIVQVGIMKINSNVKNLRLMKEKKVDTKKYSSGRSFGSITSTITTEIDVRGKNLEEARHLIDKYLDEAYLSSIERVTIIHGKGTGVLRSGLKTFFKRHSHIKSHRFGEFGEGGDGVSIIELKK